MIFDSCAKKASFDVKIKTPPERDCGSRKEESEGETREGEDDREREGQRKRGDDREDCLNETF